MPEISFARLIERTMPEKAILQSDDKQTGYENIQGTIECDEESEGELPKIVTGDKEFKWAELGRELMTYEGFRITIKIIDSDP
jgi:hypothetical protein